MTYRHIIQQDGTYVIQDWGNEEVGALPDGATEVDERPGSWYDRVDGAWAENAERKHEVFALDVRGERDFLLKNNVDPIVSNSLRWAAMSEQEQADMSAYRMALLDVPQQAGFPYTISWPSL